MQRLGRQARSGCVWAVTAMALVVAASCGSSDPQKPALWPDGKAGPREDGAIYLDSAQRDIGQIPDIQVDEGGPTIDVLEPKEGALVIGTTLTVRAKITDSDGVDDQSVKVTLQGGEEVTMGITAEPNVYSALIDVSALRGVARLVVVAADLVAKKGSLVRTFERDAGPVIVFLSPAQDSRHKGSVSIQVAIADRVDVTSFEARIGTEVLTLQETVSTKERKVYAGTVKFDDPKFPVPLSGTQVLSATATNVNGATTIEQRRFVIDDEGPAITIIGPKAGELIGGLIEIEAEIADSAGLLASSVVAVVGRDLGKRRLPLREVSGTPGVFAAQFDTRTLDDWDLWPVISVRAADRLGNESHRDITVGVDNGQPIVALDPSPQMFMVRDVDGVLECSRRFDPVGDDAVGDLEAVPQIATIRVRIEDQGNSSTVPSAEWVPISGVDNGTPKLYVLDDTAQALAVDSTGDGFCDSINPEVVPLGSAPLPGQAIAVDLVPVNSVGVPDYRPDGLGSAEHGGVCLDGTGTDEPKALCEVTGAPPVAGTYSGPAVVDMTYALRTTIAALPAIYVPGPAPSDPLRCAGLPFDFRANEVADGWVCVAAAARDGLGHLGVSKPLRLWVDHGSSRWLKGEQPPASAGAAPSCTGTLDPATGRVDASKPCKFRAAGERFPQSYPLREYRKVL